MSKLLTVLVVASALLIPSLGPVTAQETNEPFNPTFGYDKIFKTLPQSNFDDVQSIDNLIEIVLWVISILIGILALVGLIVSGIMFITAGGDVDRAAKAKNNVIWIITGMLIYMLSLYIITWIAGTLNYSLTLPNPFLPD